MRPRSERSPASRPATPQRRFTGSRRFSPLASGKESAMASENQQSDLHEIWQSQSMEGFTMTTGEIQNRIAKVSWKARRRNYGGFVACGIVIAGCIWWLTLFH